MYQRVMLLCFIKPFAQNALNRAVTFHGHLSSSRLLRRVVTAQAPGLVAGFAGQVRYDRAGLGLRVGAATGLRLLAHLRLLNCGNSRKGLLIQLSCLAKWAAPFGTWEKCCSPKTVDRSSGHRCMSAPPAHCRSAGIGARPMDRRAASGVAHVHAG